MRRFSPISTAPYQALTQIKIGVRRFSLIRSSSFFRHLAFVIRHCPGALNPQLSTPTGDVLCGLPVSQKNAASIAQKMK